MNMTQRQFRLTAVATALMTVFGAALAEEDDIAALIEPDSTVSIGIGNWSGDRHQQGIYDGMRDGKAYGLIDADINKRDNETGTWLKLKATDLGLDNREIKGEYLRQGDLGVALEYNRITRDDPKTFRTNLQGAGTARQVYNTGGPAYDLKLGTVREQTNVSVYKNLFPGLDFNLSFKNEEKTGMRQWSRGANPDFLAEPIDANTRQVEANLSYTTKQFQIQGGYYGSWYDNKYKQVIAHPLSGINTGNANTNFMSVPLNNEAHQLFLNGGYNFTKATRGTFKLEYSQASQNDNLSSTPWTGANPSQATLASAPGSLNAKVVTTLAQIGLTARPIKDLSLNANLRYHDVNDKTPVRTFSNDPAGTSPDYTAFSYRTITGKLDGTYRIDDNYSLTVGVEDKRQDRDLPVRANGGAKQLVVPMRRQIDELTSRLELRRSLSDTMNGSVAYVNASRTGSGDVAGNSNLTNSTNPMHIADRKRDKVRLAFDWAPTDALSFQFSAEEGRDRYDNGARPYGLNKGAARLYGIDAAYTVSEKLKLNAWYAYDQSKAEQTAATTTILKNYDLQETGHSFGAGLRAEATSRLNLGANVEWFHSVSKYQQTLTPVQPAQAGLPDIRNTHLKLSMFSLYALDKQSDLRFDLIHQRWKTDDWSYTFGNGQAFSYNGTTITADPKQISNFIGARYIYKFQ